MTASDARARELADRLGAVRDRIETACRDAGRDPAGITLVVVTKHFPAEDVVRLQELGVTDVGENRDQEAGPKVREALDVIAARGQEPPRVHFVGQLQTNKAGHVARYADVVHSVDRVRLVRALARGAENADRSLTALVQVRLDGDPGRGGVAPDGVAEVADAIEAEPRLVLGGVMAVAPRGVEPDDAFARLAAVSEELVRRHPAATGVSAGMSGDLEAAIRHGATHLRVGTAILGSRPSLL